MIGVIRGLLAGATLVALTGDSGLGTRDRTFGASASDTTGRAAAILHALSPVPNPKSRPFQEPQRPNTPYDGRFTFARIKFDAGGGDGGWGRRDLKWDHDYSRGERNFMRILHEITAIRPHLSETNVYELDDPELAKFPVAYLCEPGFWQPTDAEVLGLRTYLQKGGFIIFDDFAGQHWYNFTEQFRRVMPEARLVPLDTSHPIFDSFFHIESLDMDHPNYRAKAQFLGVFEDNDPNKRLLAIVNYNNDIGDYWEWSDEGFLPIELSNQAYRLGVNYVVYAMTH